MQLNVAKEVAAMQRMTTKELRGRYAEVFGEPTAANNKAWLIKRIARRLQSLAEGDLSERARQRAVELARDADLRLSPPRVPAGAPAPERTQTGVLGDRNDDRLPPPGSIITRVYRGELLQVKVLEDVFEFEGETYKSLSAGAKAITGSHCNGYLFFRLGEREAS
jgi:Protein of unknown function (DUF2924)